MIISQIKKACRYDGYEMIVFLETTKEANMGVVSRGA